MVLAVQAEQVCLAQAHQLPVHLLLLVEVPLVVMVLSYPRLGPREAVPQQQQLCLPPSSFCYGSWRGTGSFSTPS